MHSKNKMLCTSIVLDGKSCMFPRVVSKLSQLRPALKSMQCQVHTHLQFTQLELGDLADIQQDRELPQACAQQLCCELVSWREECSKTSAPCSSVFLPLMGCLEKCQLSKYQHVPPLTSLPLL